MTQQKHDFKTEVKELLSLMIHSLYSHKEIFLRELISNASDAIDKAKYESLTNKEIGQKEWTIRLAADKDAGTLTVSDNGIGMTQDEAIKHLGTIAHSGTAEFLSLLKSREIQEHPELIGQFGVGFYASFMIADKVTVVSKKAGSGESALRWESAADGTFTIDDADRANTGTDVILHVREEDKKYLDEWEIRQIVRKYSDYIEYPVVMEVEREEKSEIDKDKTVKMRKDETLNSQKAIWLRDKADISDSDYNEFYKHIAHDFTDPAKVIHYKAEGTTEFTSLLYIPSQVPFDIFYKEYKIGPSLYVKRVQIMDHCEEIIPVWLRFVKGVVDSADLPLNVSREILQNNRQVDIMKKSITKKVLDTLGDMKRDEREKYEKFYEGFGRVLKEGIHFDHSRHEAIAELLLFASTKTEAGKSIALPDYVDRMKPDQQEIFYITAPSYEEAMRSPYLEAFAKKDLEVLIMTDEVDPIIMGDLHEFKGKKLKSITRGDIALDKDEEKEKKEADKKFGKLLDLIKEQLKDEVKEVRFSGRLTDSPCCLVTDDNQMDPSMERIFKAMGQEMPENKRILEINPHHAVIEAMQAVFEKDAADISLKENIGLLYDQALLLSGEKPKNPSAFAQAVAKMMAERLKK
ncbi:MAG TPA: molecular chaperone HtpG [Dissulfurispiraceae bacterium]|nr:molecular chaperone HtpG [Dissulfurispiraceae bacterium]